MWSNEPKQYGPVFSPLLESAAPMPLDAGRANAGVRNNLADLTIAAAFDHLTVLDEHAAGCCLSAVWLLHGFLEESHSISQGIDTPEGSFWHGIMHRREGDFSNAKYWFRKVGPHPVFEDLATFSGRPDWDPAAFVDECSRSIRGGPSDSDCLELQQREWELLFDYCFHAATTAG